jgi:DNA-binding IclR family transcriptional regulator
VTAVAGSDALPCRLIPRNRGAPFSAATPIIRLVTATAASDSRGTPPLSSGVKLLGVLSCLAETTEPVRVADVARQLGTSRAVIHRQLVTLVVAGWVSQTEDGLYQLTMRAARLGQAAFNHLGLSDRTLGLLRHLAETVGEVVSLGVLDAAQIRIVQRAEPGRLLRGAGALGPCFSLGDSASGRVIVANMGPAVVESLRARGVQLPDEAELARIRSDGYASHAISREVDAVAVPVLGPGSVLALSVIGPRDRVDVASTVEPLRSTAEAVGRMLSAARDLDAADVEWGWPTRGDSSAPTAT